MSGAGGGIDCRRAGFPQIPPMMNVPMDMELPLSRGGSPVGLVVDGITGFAEAPSGSGWVKDTLAGLPFTGED